MTSDDYNRMVLEQIDFAGHVHATDCPQCENQKATERIYEEVCGGAVNSYTELNCSECGYHECDSDFCDECNLFSSEPPEDYQAAVEVHLRMENLVNVISTEYKIDPFEWGLIKKIIYQYGDGILMYFAIDDGNSFRHFINSLKQELLDARFKAKLNVAIEVAKHS
ncbi:hypothetical protein [Enterovibrio norvegicus]|uniref:hypothetical protein n=1 Tax=Enterovibrio norvegicus TaxID=188144 RepID=UPI000C82DC3C|nr:hypothetical protein [Enterovibrio norvegicus]PMH64529.1 hypothetical protein BCU62_15860 [Enterovibrio norvegicus]